MSQKILKVHPDDNIIVTLIDLKANETVTLENENFVITTDIKAKHKFATKDFKPNDNIIMYGVLVGKAKQNIKKGEWVTTFNIQHATSSYTIGTRNIGWQQPDVSAYKNREFLGFHRQDGSVGTANYWIVLPMVFCENQNLETMKTALIENLGYQKTQKYKHFTKELISLYQSGKTTEEILNSDIKLTSNEPSNRIFENIDGVKFLNHDMGCGGTRQDAQALCGLLAGYITHPNVAGATILSLGCQNAQYQMLEAEISKRGGAKGKEIFFLDQQQIGNEETMVSEAIKKTFAGLIEANKTYRQPAALSKLIIGLECGGSDGFSGISANPAVGYTSDLLVALGGTVILAEFPELCGVEQQLSDRCVTEKDAEKFNFLMSSYNDKAKAVGSGFEMNPSPGNIKDGLITDAIKSAGAAKKGGMSPITAVLNYPEKSTQPGLNLLCTPGNDVESTTAEVGSGANIVLFTTGLGTPTGNPIAPVIKIASNTALAQKMSDIIDINTGTIIEGTETIEDAGNRILEFVINAASGIQPVKSVINGQDDFIPWRQDISL